MPLTFSVGPTNLTAIGHIITSILPALPQTLTHSGFPPDQMLSIPQDQPPNPNPNPPPPPPPAAPPHAAPPSMLPNPLRGSHHRRARSELPFRISDEFTDPLSTSNNFDEAGSEEDLFSTFMDIEKIGCRLEVSGSGSDSGACQDPAAAENGGGLMGAVAMAKPKHRHSSSVDGSVMSSLGEVMEAKKAMSAEQLAELAAIDPKRAKR